MYDQTVHRNCLHFHRVTPFPIILGEAECLRQYPLLFNGGPDHEFGNIYVGLCPRGTTLLAEVAGKPSNILSLCWGIMF